MTVKINKLEIENVKRVKAVQLEPSQNGLTIIGGRNNQGKTSVLDSIAWVLGGNKFKPSEPKREDSITPPIINATLSNGLVVRRDGKNSDLKVIDPSGNRNGQQLLDEFIAELALDLPKFMESNSKDKGKTLLQIIGVGDKLYELEREEQDLYNQRRTMGQIADQKQKHAAEMEFFSDAPKELISVSELIQQQQAILAQNGENQKKRAQVNSLLTQAANIQEQLDQILAKQKQILADLDIAKKSAQDLHDESTEELEANIASVEDINNKIRSNMEREKADQDAQEYLNRYEALTDSIESVRKAKIELLTGANLPLAELSVEDGELVYKGQKWDCLSSSDQLRVAVAIVRKLNPNCGFVLLDKLEQMDLQTMKEFGAWLEGEGLQVIATRVSSGSECSIIIEDGYSVSPDRETPKFEKGTF